MTFISYSQNFEDVMLWRALKHIENGFYIDVGANSPIEDSITKAFYVKGWRGINVEPLVAEYIALARDRTFDINLQCAVGNASGELTLWNFGVRGWATASEEVAANLINQGYQAFTLKVPVMTLNEICNQYVKGDIHFLKIDVEGFEESVLNGANFSQHRPWIVLIEATKPNSQTEVHLDWEGVLNAASYHFAYSDGLNRFYVADEHSELLIKFRNPPNVFDDFIRHQEVEIADKLNILSEANHKLSLHLEGRDQELKKILSSRSWRLTKPLRSCFFLLRKCRPTKKIFITSANSFFNKFLGKIAKLLQNHPRIKCQLKRLFLHFPHLRNKLDMRLKYRQLNANLPQHFMLSNLEMPKEAVEIYSELKASLRRSNN
jgi:FkbM family methyltransferase